MADLPPESRDVIIDGKRLETLRYPSAAQAPNIVMLHEGLGSISMWRDFPEQLAQRTGCGVFMYSRYGHGKSQRLSEKRSVDFMNHEAKVVLPPLLDLFQIQRPIVLGHSDGGSIAVIYAATSPGTVRALILEAPHLFVEDFGLKSIQTIGEIYENSHLAESLGRHHDHADEMFWGWNEIWLNPDFRSWNIEAYLDAIKCPVLVMQGDQDEYGTLAQVQAIQNRVATAESVIVSRCGHAPHREQPATTLELMANFIAGLK